MRTYRRSEALFALADQIEARFQKAQFRIRGMTPSLLARAWIHSPPARSGCALLLRRIVFARSQRAQIHGQLVPHDFTDQPAERLLNRIRSKT